MCAPVIFAFFAVDLGWAGPALWRAKDDHWPHRPALETSRSGILPDTLNIRCNRVEGGCHELMHLLWLVTLYEIRLITIALEQLLQLFPRNAGEKTRVCDLVTIEVKDRQYSAITHRVQELVSVPSRCQRA